MTLYSNKDMVSITEHYIFIKPYHYDDPTNKHHPLLNEKVEELRADKEACQQAEEMRRLFLESQQCLCHGDLHTGSVMVKDRQPKVRLDGWMDREMDGWMDEWMDG